MGVRHNRREEGAEWNGVIETKQQPGYVKIDDRERERETNGSPLFNLFKLIAKIYQSGIYTDW